MKIAVLNETESKALREGNRNARTDGYIRKTLPQKLKEKIKRAAHRSGERFRIPNRRNGHQHPVAGCNWEDVNVNRPRKKGGEQSADSVYWRIQGWVV